MELPFESVPLFKDSTRGEKPYYQLTCECGAVEVYSLREGIVASTNRCYRCYGLAFGLRKREYVTEESISKIESAKQL